MAGDLICDCLSYLVVVESVFFYVHRGHQIETLCTEDSRGHPIETLELDKHKGCLWGLLICF